MRMVPAAFLAAMGVATAALAQAPPDPQMVEGNLRQQLGQAMFDAGRFQQQVAQLTQQLAEARAMIAKANTAAKADVVAAPVDPEAAAASAKAAGMPTAPPASPAIQAERPPHKPRHVQ